MTEAALKKPRLKFFSETIDELRKVTWLKWPNEILYLSFLVMVVAVAVGLLMGGIDYVFNFLITKFAGG